MQPISSWCTLLFMWPTRKQNSLRRSLCGRTCWGSSTGDDVFAQVVDCCCRCRCAATYLPWSREYKRKTTQHMLLFCAQLSEASTFQFEIACLHFSWMFNQICFFFSFFFLQWSALQCCTCQYYYARQSPVQFKINQIIIFPTYF